MDDAENSTEWKRREQRKSGWHYSDGDLLVLLFFTFNVLHTHCLVPHTLALAHT